MTDETKSVHRKTRRQNRKTRLARKQSFARQIFERDGWNCHYCGERVHRVQTHGYVPKKATIDHKHPRSLGGSLSKENAVTACEECNRDKADIPYKHYMWFRKRRVEGKYPEKLLREAIWMSLKGDIDEQPRHPKVQGTATQDHQDGV